MVFNWTSSPEDSQTEDQGSYLAASARLASTPSRSSGHPRADQRSRTQLRCVEVIAQARDHSEEEEAAEADDDQG